MIEELHKYRVKCDGLRERNGGVHLCANSYEIWAKHTLDAIERKPIGWKGDSRETFCPAEHYLRP